MARGYDNWERLVTAILKREDLRLTGQRTPSELSVAALSSFSSLNVGSSSRRVSSFSFSSFAVGVSCTHDQILQATDYLKESNLIKRGRSGDLFSGVLDEGSQVVVKRIDLSSVDKQSFFITELEVLKTVSQHHGFVPLLGHCLEKKDQKFLVYRHMPKNDLSTCLSRKSPFLDWKMRLNIAVQLAESLAYLHHQCVPPLVHGDIQASSLLLDNNFEVRLGNLYKVCAEEKDIAPHTVVARESNLGTPGKSNASYGTRAYDVYSFGKVLLELVTGMSGFSATENSTMEDWMENALSYIVPDKKELVQNIVDLFLIIDMHLWAQVWAVAFIAKACLCPESSKRPQMAQIILALEHTKSARFTDKNFEPIYNHGIDDTALVITEMLRGSEIRGKMPQETGDTTLGSHTALENHGILEHPKLPSFSYSEVMDATRGLWGDTVLKEGEFSTITQARLQDKFTSNSSSGRTLVSVRKFYSQKVPLLNDWQSRIHLLGGLSHPNLVRFLGYCLEDKELFIVHEHMPSGSLENHLFRTSSDVQPLSWDTRMKILFGVARGMAFLHETESKGHYEYFGTSDILLDYYYNAKISGIGTAKITRRTVLDEVLDPVRFKKLKYFDGPPEYFKTAGRTNEGDVFGFGVVMAEMLTGLSAKGRYRLGLEKCHLVPFFRYHMDGRRNKLEKIVDRQLKGKYPPKAAQQLGSFAIMCLQDDPDARFSMKEVVTFLDHITFNEKGK